MTNLSHIFPSGYLNIPTEEDLRFEVQDMLRYACTDKQIMDQLRSIRCPYLRKAMALCLSGYWHELVQLRDDRTGYYDGDGDWRIAWIYFDSDMRQIIKHANCEQVELEMNATTIPTTNATPKQITTTQDMKKEQPNYQIKMENCNVIMGDSIGGLFTLPGSNVTVNQYADAKSQPKQAIEGASESVDERNARKRAALNEMCSRLENLEYAMIGCDQTGKQLDYLHLTSFLRKALGMLEQGNKEEFLSVQERIWTILIDRRDKCHKDPKDLFYPQTYLGLVGYLVEKEVINGKPQKILDCLYEKNDQSMLKNLKRSIVSAFPEGTREMLDFYIDLMKRQLLI